MEKTEAREWAVGEGLAEGGGAPRFLATSSVLTLNCVSTREVTKREVEVGRKLSPAESRGREGNKCWEGDS